MLKDLGFIAAQSDDRQRRVAEGVVMPALRSNNYRPYLALGDRRQRNILVEILRKLHNSAIAVVDLTGLNPNVLYELGLLHAFRTPTILMAEKKWVPKLPFDLMTEHVLEYTHHVASLRQLEDELTQRVGGILTDDRSSLDLVELVLGDVLNKRDRARERWSREQLVRVQYPEFVKKFLSATDDPSLGKVSQAIAKQIVSLHDQHDGRIAVGVAGPSGVGLSRTAANLVTCITDIAPDCHVLVVPTDAFMLDRPTRREQGISGYSPRASKSQELRQALTTLRSGGSISFSPYNHKSGLNDLPECHLSAKERSIIVVEGVQALGVGLQDLIDFGVFLSLEAEDAKGLRFLRDVIRRNYPPSEAFRLIDKEYEAFKKYIAPQQRAADCVVRINELWQFKLL